MRVKTRRYNSTAYAYSSTAYAIYTLLTSSLPYLEKASMLLEDCGDSKKGWMRGSRLGHRDRDLGLGLVSHIFWVWRINGFVLPRV